MAPRDTTHTRNLTTTKFLILFKKTLVLHKGLKVFNRKALHTNAFQFLKKIHADKNAYLSLAHRYDHLISPEQFIYELLPAEKYTEDPGGILKFIKHSITSTYSNDIYQTNNLYLAFADKFAKETKNQVFISEIDIKGCTKLINYVSSKEIYNIQAFINYSIVEILKKKLCSDCVYVFDVMKNDDSLIIINSDVDINVLRTYMVEAINVITNSIYNKYPDLDLGNWCILGFAIIKLGKNKTFGEISRGLADKINIRLEHFDEKIPFRKSFDINIPKASMPELKSDKIREMLNNISSQLDDFAGCYCERESNFNFNNKGKTAINIKINNFSGLNKLTGDKSLCYEIFERITGAIAKIIKTHDARMYFVGLNSIIIIVDEQDVSKLCHQIQRNIDRTINHKRIYNFFSIKIGHLKKSMRFSDIYSAKGYPNGFSISNVNSIPADMLTNKEAVLNFKIDSYTKYVGGTQCK